MPSPERRPRAAMDSPLLDDSMAEKKVVDLLGLGSNEVIELSQTAQLKVEGEPQSGPCLDDGRGCTPPRVVADAASLWQV